MEDPGTNAEVAEVGDSPASELPSGAVRGARPASDAITMDAVRARVEQSLFGAAADAHLGRYVVLDRIAGGGMGVVYRAEDPELHRKVALKVLHPRQLGDARARQRMLGEARALARLDHPNVVKIYDVLTHGDQIVLVMALIEGATLAEWEHAAPRSWRELVHVYAQAGDGLAAAHALEIIHRDFKPANAIIAGDGRVSVLDFGLARVADAADSAPALGSPDAPDLDGPHGLTATGEIVGTLGYTSPEQLAGRPATQASDQFSFCVALHRAIEGVPPFTGGDAVSRLRSIRAGALVRATDRSVPSWLRTLLARGLAADPTARFPSMAVLLRELRRPRGWRRWRVPAAAVVVAGAFAVIAANRSSPSALDLPCDGGIREIDAVWGPVPRAQLDGSLRTLDAPEARDLRDRVLARLDVYRERWIELHRDACTSHRRGVQSSELLDRRMACMARRRGDLQAAVDVLRRTDRATAVNVLDVAARLPELDACADVARLQAEAEPPATAQRPSVDAIRGGLARAAALDRAGRSEEARNLARASAADAEQLGYAPLIAEASLLHGTILLRRSEFAAATAPLSRARGVGLEHRLLALAVEAGARQLYVEAMQDNRHTDLLRDAALLEPISRGLAGDHFARPLLLNNIGTVQMADGDRASARRSFDDAHAALQGVASPDLELTCIDKNRAMLTPDPAERTRLARGVWERRRDALGEHHLFTLDGLDSYARYEADPEAAWGILAEECAGYDAHPELIGLRMYCHSYRAFLTEYRGDAQGAQAIYLDIARLAEHAAVRDSFWGELATGHSRRLAGDAAGAIAAFAPVFAACSESRDWWVRYRAADAELGWGLAEQARGHVEEAGRHLHHAATMYDEIALHNEETEFRLRAALARRAISVLAPR
ncbi:MAG TPA: serine/threonine-protein kinase [Kofleriaceae bacterium]|jgi:serine/threonine protein kinase